jgi:glycosyltransferase involved in cell wall biosynthesis
MTRKPLVSVIIITYNQENYIGQALESIVTQKTSFEFEVLVGDDMSTDKTPAIISDFAQRYPAIIKPIIRKKNLGPAPNFVETLKLSQGRYIAICEGDDYWTDPLKLQRQADFLDANPDCVVCFHPVRVIYENGTHEDEIYPVQKDGFTLERLVEGNFIQTNSVMYRATNYNDLPDDILPLWQCIAGTRVASGGRIQAMMQNTNFCKRITSCTKNFTRELATCLITKNTVDKCSIMPLRFLSGCFD